MTTTNQYYTDEEIAYKVWEIISAIQFQTLLFFYLLSKNAKIK
jgi:hypothetical protein